VRLLRALIRVGTVAILGALLLLTQAGAAFACVDHHPRGAVAAARAATARYHNLDVAKRAGYAILADTAGITCIAMPGMGAMGVHYVRGDLVADPAIRLTRPEALVYAPDSRGRLHLAALEYVVLKADWDADHARPPRLFGHDFNVTAAPNRYGLPTFYSLHAWIWKYNPAGTFEMWNPRVHCT
jgi:hypothetical protein